MTVGLSPRYVGTSGRRAIRAAVRLAGRHGRPSPSHRGRLVHKTPHPAIHPPPPRSPPGNPRLFAAEARAVVNTADITLSAGTGTALTGSTFAEIDLLTDGAASIMMDSVPGLPDLLLSQATVDVDGTKHALTIQGPATVLGLNAELLITADWATPPPTRRRPITFAVKLNGAAPPPATRLRSPGVTGSRAR
jgi:hypothetical protein